MSTGRSASASEIRSPERYSSMSSALLRDAGRWPGCCEGARIEVTSLGVSTSAG